MNQETILIKQVVNDIQIKNLNDNMLSMKLQEAKEHLTDIKDDLEYLIINTPNRRVNINDLRELEIKQSQLIINILHEKSKR